MKKVVYLSLALWAFQLNVSAQDDLYFVPTKENVAKSAADYGMPRDAYYAGSRRAIDDYNRRGSFVQPLDSAGNDVISLDGVAGVYPDSVAGEMEDYECTRRMNRFDDYDWSGSYWAGYNDGRFDSWGWHSPWYWDYPYYYGYSSWYWDYPYYYGSWYWNRPWYGGGWYGGHYVHHGGGYASVPRNGVRRFSSADFRGARGGNSSSTTMRSFGNSSRGFSGQRSSATQGNFGGVRSSSTFNNTTTSRQPSSFSGSSSFGGARSSGSFGGARGGGSVGGGSRGGSFGGRR